MPPVSYYLEKTERLRAEGRLPGARPSSPRTAKPSVPVVASRALPVVAPSVKKALPVACPHAEASDAGPKGWHLCNHPDEPLGMWVCACKGCGPKCYGHPSHPSNAAKTPPGG